MNLSMIVLGSLSGGLMSILKEDIKKKNKKKQVGNWGKKKRSRFPYVLNIHMPQLA